MENVHLNKIHQANSLSPVVSDEFHIVTGMTSFYTINAYRIAIRRVASLTAVKVVHRKGSVRWDFVQALAISNRFLHRILITKYFIAWKNARWYSRFVFYHAKNAIQ